MAVRSPEYAAGFAAGWADRAEYERRRRELDGLDFADGVEVGYAARPGRPAAHARPGPGMRHVTANLTAEPAPTAVQPPCGCARQADLWLCQARPHLTRTPYGHRCELGQLLDATTSDHWPGTPIGGHRV